MKLSQRILFLTFAGLVAFLVFAQTRETQPFKELMRRKLDHAQSVLEGIAVEDFDLIRVHGGKLRALSEQPGWVLFDTAEYAEQSLLFKRNVDKLSKAARDRNLDAATLAYTKVTFSCVECHKYIRDRRIESLIPAPSEKPIPGPQSQEAR